MSDQPVKKLTLEMPMRRRVLAGMVGAPMAVALAGGSAPVQAALKTSARIVILGSGLGGLAVANRLVRELDGAQITIVDRKEIHNYQPGYTLVGTGIWPVSKVADRNSEFQPAGVNWVQEMATEVDADAQVVVTDAATRIPYDFLVVATGLQIDLQQVVIIRSADDAVVQNRFFAIFLLGVVSK